MPMTTPPEITTRGRSGFSAQVAAFVTWLTGTFIGELDAVVAAFNFNSTTDTSTTSNAIATGAKTFTVSASKSFSGGMFLMIADTAAPSTNWMFGQVTSYSGTTLVMNITSIGGSGTKTAWTISQSAAGGASGNVVAGLGSNTFTGAQNLARATVASAATTADIWAAAGNSIDWTGTVTCTGFPAAPQAGASRKLICAAAASFTAGANMLIGGVPSGSTITLAANDEVTVEAITTTTFLLTPRRYSGAGVVGLDRIQPISASVAANALTITLAPTVLDFRSATIGSGTVNTRTVASALSLVVSSGSTLGTVSAVANQLAVIAIDNAGTVDLAVVNVAGGTNLDETTLISTTAEGGAGAADSATTIYSTTARASVPFRIVGYIESTQATAGAWATAPSKIQGAGGNAVSAWCGLGYGQAWTDVAGSRNFATTYYNTTGRPILVNVGTQVTGTNTATLSVSINGGGALVFANNTAGGAIASSGMSGTILIPPGASYAITASAGTKNIWLELR